MDQTSKSSGFGRVSSLSFNVSQLDKVNAIPNKIKDGIMLGDLCTGDQLYITSLMDHECPDIEEAEEALQNSSAWSPMVHSPVLEPKRMKKMKTPYAITMSLEDISYIRPSWGISKGVKTIELNKNPKKDRKKKENEAPEVKIDEHKENRPKRDSYYYYMIFVIFFVIFMFFSMYLVDRRKTQNQISSNKISLDVSSRMVEIYRPNREDLDTIMRIRLAGGIARDLKPVKCSCDTYSIETNKRNKTNNTGTYSPVNSGHQYCFSCLDWADRVNMRLLVNRSHEDESFCYLIKWQSYDSLKTPLVDCFLLGNDDWFGLGDVISSQWPLNNIELDWTPLTTNLPTYNQNQTSNGFSSKSSLGSYVDFSLLSSNGVHIGDIRTDFALSIKISRTASGEKSICLAASCTYKCTQKWARTDHIEKLKYRNNILEYRICTSSDLNSLISRQIREKTRVIVGSAKRSEMNHENKSQVEAKEPKNFLLVNDKLIEKESSSSTIQPVYTEGPKNFSSKLDHPQSTISSSPVEPIINVTGTMVNHNNTIDTQLPEGIGLIERTIFATSLEFVPVLDGNTLRQYVDNIVKLGLKTSSILLIDSRWETYVGSLKLNTVLFPKAKLLFEILHNKGFKIVFTVKPFIDAAIGMFNIDQLVDSGRIYTVNMNEQKEMKSPVIGQDVDSKPMGTIVRRQSFFTFHNQNVSYDISSKFPYLFKCEESPQSYCVLLDLTLHANRVWMINNIKRSSLLSSEANGIQIAGCNPNGFDWIDHYKEGMSELAKDLVYKEKLYTLTQWTGDFGYIQLAPRRCDWDSLRSVINSVLNLGTMGFTLIHPGSVWGDLKNLSNMTPQDSLIKTPNRMDIYGDQQSSDDSDKELVIRWLQVSVFLPILQFKNMAPIERHGLQDMLQNLVKTRKLYIVPELKRNLPFTPLISQSKPYANVLPVIRMIIYTHGTNESIVYEQFTIGSDILVAPILAGGVRQRDIYLPNGFWRDELRQTNIRGGKWLRNYPVQLNEISWFTRVKRRRRSGGR